MRQRLAIASALLMPRDLLVLDEPTNGLDPQGTREVRHLIGDLADDGATVLVSSHLLAEVEQMCSHVGVMYEGRLVVAGPDGRAARRRTVQTVRVDTDRPTEDAARVLRELGLADVTVGHGSRHGHARRGGGGEDRAEPGQRRRAGARLRRAAAEPGGRLRRRSTGEGFDVSG